MRGDRDPFAQRELAWPVSEDLVTLIVVAMLTSMTIVLSGAASLAITAFSVLR